MLTLLAILIVLGGAVLPSVTLDVVAVLALSVLVLGGVLTPQAGLEGFGSTTLVVVAGMFVLAEALQRTGALQRVGGLLEHAASRGHRALMLTMLPVVMLLSGIMNNTAVVLLFLPMLVALGQETRVSPSRLLLPLSYGSITGGTLTLVGTTTTLLVDGIVRQTPNPATGHPYPGLGFLDILPMGVVFCAIALLYLAFVGPRLLPDRTGLLTPISARSTRQYMTEVVLGPRSQFVGHRLAEDPQLARRLRVLQLVRGEETFWPPFDDVVLRPDDLLLLKGSPADIVKVLDQPGLHGPPDPEGGGRIARVDLALAEVMVAPRSRLDHQTVRDARVRDRFGVVVLAVLRSGEHLREGLGSLRMRVGDILLVQGEPGSLERLARNERDLVLLGGTPPPSPRRARAPVAVGATAVALALSALGWVPLPIAVLLAAVAVISAGCLTSGQAYRAVDLRIVVVLGCMLGVGAAASRSGLAGLVAERLLALGHGLEGGLGPAWANYGVLAMIYLATSLLTEVVTNAGTAAIMVPIALETAERAHVSHRPFVLAVALAASCSFLTPIGYQTNLLVHGPGGYRLRDYLRLGTPLVLVLWITATLLLPLVYPF
jgi:di/tricarboxylate transporter